MRRKWKPHRECFRRGYDGIWMRRPRWICLGGYMLWAGDECPYAGGNDGAGAQRGLIAKRYEAEHRWVGWAFWS